MVIDFLLNVFSEAGQLFLESSVYMLFGFLVAGAIHGYFPESKISKYLGRRNWRSVLNASLIGIPLPLCSCAVLPTAIALRRNGASRGSTLAFLISTPETGVDSIGVSFALLDPILAIVRPIAAFLTALIAGIGANVMERRQTERLVEGVASQPAVSCNCQEDDCARESDKKDQNTFVTRFRSAIRYAFGELLDDLAGWLILGFLVAGIIGVILPDNFFAGYLGAGFGSMVVLLIVGIPLYICATASTPIAAAMLLKGLSPGAALVFLLAGPATNISSLLILRKYFEKKYLLLYLITISVVALLLGLLLNGFYSALNLDVRATLGSGAEFIPAWLEISAAFVLGILILLSLLRKAQHWWLKYHS